MRDSNLHIIRPLQRGACRAQSEMNSTSRRNEPSIAKPGILRWQCIELAVLVLTTALIAVMDSELARAIAVGGLIALIPQMYFAFHAFRFRGARAMRQVTHSFYRGEAGKFLLTCCPSWYGMQSIWQWRPRWCDADADRTLIRPLRGRNLQDNFVPDLHCIALPACRQGNLSRIGAWHLKALPPQRIFSTTLPT
jgi:hypothetical protein